MTEIPEDLLRRSQAARRRSEAPGFPMGGYKTPAKPADPPLTIAELREIRTQLGDTWATLSRISDRLGLNFHEVGLTIDVTIDEVNQRIGALT